MRNETKIIVASGLKILFLGISLVMTFWLMFSVQNVGSKNGSFIQMLLGTENQFAQKHH